jgi:hypothetical protein
MKNLLGLFLILVIALTSCEGRKTQSQALSEDIEEFKKEITFEVAIYKPETYMEREVDTLLHNGYSVKIKTYADMDNTVLFTKIKDTINYQTHYRNFKFDILVEKDGQSIYQAHFDKKKINTLLEFDSETKSSNTNHDFENLGILKSIDVNNELPLSDSVKIDIMYAVPETDKMALHSLSIDNKGLLKVERVEIN